MFLVVLKKRCRRHHAIRDGDCEGIPARIPAVCDERAHRVRELPRKVREWNQRNALRRCSRSMKRYKLSTFARAHGVLRKNLRLDETLGSL